MQGLVISSKASSRSLDLDRLADKIQASIAEQPYWRQWAATRSLRLSNFSRYFGVLMPEILQRSWLVTTDSVPPIGPHFFAGPEGDSQTDEAVAAELASVERHVLEQGEQWQWVEGEYLIRAANGLEEDLLTLIGCPTNALGEVRERLAALGRDDTATSEDAKDVIEPKADLAFCCYEGIWAAFADDLQRLARLSAHVSEFATVGEVQEGVGYRGSWLQRHRESSPDFERLLDSLREDGA